MANEQLSLHQLVKYRENNMSKTSKWLYDLQERCGFTIDEFGEPVINWKVLTQKYADNIFDSAVKMKEDLQNEAKNG